MPRRIIPFLDNTYYHVYNRGIARQPIFSSVYDYKRFLTTFSYYRFYPIPMKLSRFQELSTMDKINILSRLNLSSERVVDIVSFVLMPNHFHFLLRQRVKNGISNFIRLILNSYTKYYNTKYERTGALIQSAFKAKMIETIEQLVHVSRYVHLNPFVSGIIRESDLMDYRWSSLTEYLHGTSTLVDLKPVMSEFSSVIDYKKFVLDQLDYSTRLEQIKHLAMD